MAGKRESDVDPRFDPVFQRGYDPAVHPARSRPARAEQPREPARHEVRHEAPRHEPAAPAAPADDPTPTDAAAPAARVPDEEYEVPRRNPFRLILLLASIAAIAGSGALLWHRIATDPYGGYGGYGGDIARIFWDQFTDGLLAPLLTGGLLGLCLWLALGALRRRDDG